MKRRFPSAINGLYIVNKPAGMTSHDVVGAIRRASGERRIGHAGTLDPAAEGVLLVLVGTATRLAEYLTLEDKRYRAGIAFGQATTTDDAQGRVISQADPDALRSLTLENVEAALPRFIGPIDQVPPAFSAIKLHGQALYKLARRGVEVERQPRRVTIHSVTTVDWRPADGDSYPIITLDVFSSKGTYIRSLARDLGEALGVGGHLASLLRESSGRFHLEDSVSLADLIDSLRAGRAGEHLIPADQAVSNLPRILLDEEGKRRLTTGLDWKAPESLAKPKDGALYRLYSRELTRVASPPADENQPAPGLYNTETANQSATHGERAKGCWENLVFIGIGRYHAEDDSILPEKIFQDSSLAVEAPVIAASADTSNDTITSDRD